MTRKILYSPGFGAGWTTWESDPEVKKLMLTFPPLVEAVEKGEDVSVGIGSFGKKPKVAMHPAMEAFVQAVKAMGKEVPYLGGARDLEVMEVNGRIRIEEYDGSESVEEEGEYHEWL